MPGCKRPPHFPPHCGCPAVRQAYGPCTHPAIEKRADGRWYCTECGQLRG